MKKVLAPLFLIGLMTWLFCCRHDLFHKKEKKLTQITNNEPFRDVCKRALQDSTKFAMYKRDPIYTLFYENTTFEEGRFFLAEIQRDFPQLLQPEILKKISGLNEVGGPLVFSFNDLGKCSPSLFRYLTLAGKFQKLFGSLNGFNIIEIGGNGGLCKVLYELFPIESYTIIDFQESLELTKKHLESLGLYKVCYCTPEKITSKSCDLLVSEYIFTQSNMDLQKKYLKTLFPLAKCGYITCDFSPKFFLVKPLNKTTILEKISLLHPNNFLLPEEPRTGKENCIVIWKD